MNGRPANPQRHAPPVQLATRGGIVTGTAAAWCAALSAEAGGPVTPADLDTALAEIREAAEAVTGNPCPVVPGGSPAAPVRGLPLLDTAISAKSRRVPDTRSTDPHRRRLAWTVDGAADFAACVEAVLDDRAGAAVPGGDGAARVAPHAAPHAPISEPPAYAPA
jgi:hypothetical protein